MFQIILDESELYLAVTAGLGKFHWHQRCCTGLESIYFCRYNQGLNVHPEAFLSACTLMLSTLHRIGQTMGGKMKPRAHQKITAKGGRLQSRENRNYFQREMSECEWLVTKDIGKLHEMMKLITTANLAS